MLVRLSGVVLWCGQAASLSGWNEWRRACDLHLCPYAAIQCFLMRDSPPPARVEVRRQVCVAGTRGRVWSGWVGLRSVCMVFCLPVHLWRDGKERKKASGLHCGDQRLVVCGWAGSKARYVMQSCEHIWGSGCLFAWSCIILSSP